MGETLSLVAPRFNRSLRIESRAERLTGDPGAILLREVLENSGIVGWMTDRLSDPRRPQDVTHDLASLLRTTILLAAQGWRDHDDADALRHDPAFRLAVIRASRVALSCVRSFRAVPSPWRITVPMTSFSAMVWLYSA